MDFSAALIEVKSGFKIQRDGWNGADQYVVIKSGYSSVPANESHALAHRVRVGELVSIAPYLEIKTSDDVCFPWTPSQGDLMANDWRIIEG